jgi:imidazolonepropionase-like amidohydrolase
MNSENSCDDSAHSPGISRREFLKLTSVTAAGLMVGYNSAQGAETTMALFNGTLIDGTGAEPVPNGAVVIQGERILAAGPRKKIKIPTNADKINVQGGTILPGFINTHVHDAYNEWNLKAWAQGGVTTVRDLGAFGPYTPTLFATRNALRAIPECARLVAVGSFVNVKGGYPIVYWGGHAVTVTSPEEARQAVKMLIDDGADVIKTAMESGYSFGHSGWPLLSPEESTALVEAAHERGKTVTAHVTSARDLKRALDAGVDEIAHMVVDTLPENYISRMVEDGTRWVPTIELWQGVSRNYPVSYGTMAINNLAKFVEAGGEVSLGTDYAGAPNVNFDLGMPIHEIKWMQEAGMTPMQIIVAATRNSARSCDMERILGTLEAGKLADIIVVDGNPLADVKALTNTRLVLREGKFIKSTLSDLVK